MIDIKVKKTLQGSHGTMALDVDLHIQEHSFTALAGESGSGKTTLLRTLAGFEQAQGHIRVNGLTWLDHNSSLAVQKRNIGFVFQDYALFSNMSVENNLLYAKADKSLAEKLLQLTDLSALRDRMPEHLSGGQKQRVSLCRALMNRPKLLLMDEPLSALDPDMRTKLQHDILTLHKEFGTTTLMVSHDPSEIYRLADSVIMMNQGKVLKQGNPKEILLQTQGSQKFSLQGELLDIIESDVIYIAIVAIGQQIVEVTLDEVEASTLEIGAIVQLSAKAFALSLTSS